MLSSLKYRKTVDHFTMKSVPLMELR